MLSASIALLLSLSGPGSQSWRPPELEVRGAPEQDGEAISQHALGYLGRPYVTGGVGDPGFDCSGFVCRVYAESGHALPRVSRDQARAGEEVPLDALQPGDLVFFADPGAPISHVGMYLGDGHLVHASSGRGEVVVASLGGRWFQERLVAARRFVSTTSTAARGRREARITELVEHQGRFSLPPMLRRPPRRPRPSYGPELTGAGLTSIGFRSGLWTEEGVLGAVFAPEATLRIEGWALEVAVAVPVRLEVNEDPTLGEFERWQDYLRFLRTVKLGLRGADLELRLSRLGEASLGTGFVFDRVAPGTAVRGVPGLTVVRSPLGFFGAVRTDALEVEAFMDDALDPALLGASSSLALGPARVGVTAATDQQASFRTERRAITAAELFLRLDAVSDRRWSLDLGLSTGVVAALEEAGGGGALSLRAQWRPRGGITASAELHAGVLGPRYLAGLFGPTYLTARDAHTEALAELSTRGFVEGRGHVTWGKVSIGGAYGQGLGAHRHPFDRRIEGFVGLEALPIGRQRRLDLRMTLMSRGLFDDTARVLAAHGGARVTVFDWLFAELYVQKSETWEGGGGLTVTWAP